MNWISIWRRPLQSLPGSSLSEKRGATAEEDTVSELREGRSQSEVHRERRNARSKEKRGGSGRSSGVEVGYAG